MKKGGRWPANLKYEEIRCFAGNVGKDGFACDWFLNQPSSRMRVSGACIAEGLFAASPVMPELAETRRGRNFRLLSLYSSGIRQVMSRQPIASFETLRGKKIRV